MRLASVFVLSVCLGLCAGMLPAEEFAVGIARVKITPEKPIRMSGYAARNKPSVGVLQDLWAKCLAIRDAEGHRLVILTTDLIGYNNEFSTELFTRAKEKYGLNREEILLTCSHTHSGPVVGKNLRVMYQFSPEEAETIREYTSQLLDKLVMIIGQALENLQPAQLSVGHGNVGFAVNRREKRGNTVVLGVNPEGPVDHDVPVIKVTSPDGTLRAVLFGYACHCTTIGGNTGEDFYKIHGDYAGVAQAKIEEVHSGVTAMFTILCGGDQNPHPRGEIAYVQQHGEALAAEVERVLAGPMKAVRGPLHSVVDVAELEFRPHTREQFEQELEKALAAKDVYRERRARHMLELYDAGKPIRTVTVPIQAIRFDESLTLVAIGGEVCVEYALRLKKEFPQEDLVVVGYANDVMCYIPSKNVLLGGGYEPEYSMIYYGMPGPFAENVEETLIAALHRLLGKVGLHPVTHQARAD